MAIEVGAAYVSILPSARGFSRELLRQIRGDLSGAGQAAGKEFGDGFEETASKDIGKGVKDQLRKSNSGIGGEGTRAGKDFGAKFGGAIKSAIVPLFAGMAGGMLGGGIMDLFGSIRDAASEAEQSSGAVAAIFKQNSGQIEESAKRAANAVGLSANEYRGLAATLGAQLKNKGIADFADQTENLIGLGADLSAQFGGTTKEAVEALTSALRGETDPIERYGVSLNAAAVEAQAAAMGIKKVNGELPEQGKAMAALALIQKQTVDAQGTFNREQDTYAGKAQRAAAAAANFKTKVGDFLLPMYTDMANAVSEKVLPALDGFVTGFKDGTGAGGQFKDVLVTIKDTISAGLQFYREHSDVINSIATAVGAAVVGYKAASVGMAAYSLAMKVVAAETTAAKFAQLGLNGALLANPITWVVLAVMALVGALIYLYKNNETVRNAMDRIWKGIKDVVGGVVSWFTDTAIPGVVSAWNTVRDVFATVGSALAGVWNGVVAAASAAGQFLASVFEKIWFVARFTVGIFLTVVLVAFQLFWAILSRVFETAAGVLSAAWGVIWRAAEAVAGWFQDNLMPIFRTVADAIATAFTWLKDRVVDAWNLLMAGVKVIADWFTEYVQPVIQRVVDFLVAAFEFYKNAVTTVWNLIMTAVQVVVGWFTTYVWPVIKSVIDLLVGAFNFYKGIVLAVWSAIQTAVGVVVNWFMTYVVGTFQTAWNNIKTTFSNAWNWIDKNVLQVFRDKITALPGFFDVARKGIEIAWDQVREVVKKPIEFVVNTVIRDGVVRAWNSVAEKLSLPKWDFKGFARGGWTGPGSKFLPAGIVHADEFVIRKESQQRIAREHPGLLDYMNTHGRVPGYASGGLATWQAMEQWAKKYLPGLVMTSGPRNSNDFHGAGKAIDLAAPMNDAGKGLMLAAARVIASTFGSSILELIHTPGGPMMQLKRGKPIDYGADTLAQHFNHVHWAMESFSEEMMNIPPGEGGFTIGNPIAEGLKKLAGVPFDLANKGIDQISKLFPESQWRDMAVGFAKKPPEMVKKFLFDLIDKVFPAITFGGGEGGEAMTGNVNRWTDVVKHALAMLGQPESLVGTVLRRMNQESGGNPRAINAWDINAANGTPSKGLMQLIDPTFHAFALPGYGFDIYDPLSNILASMRYALRRYGSLSAAYDRQGGYSEGGLVKGPMLFDTGGYLPTGLTLVRNNTGQPERVLNPQQERAMMERGGDVYNIHGVPMDRVGPVVEALEFQTRKARLSRRYR